MESNDVQYRCVEFYSGIGGMHYGLELAGIGRITVVAAFDINTTANAIYRHNFPTTELRQNNIEAISLAQLEKYRADIWTMSPPCQPFTKKGLQLGEDDRRTDSFFSLMDKLPEMTSPPRMILVENVVGFETSSVRDQAVLRLHDAGYRTQEYILSPLQFGVPNTRPRYYLLAHRHDSFPDSTLSMEPAVRMRWRGDEVAPVSEYLEDDSCIDGQNAALKLDSATVNRYAAALDIVTRTSRRSACFTKSYSSYITGCGSYYCNDDIMVEGNKLLPEAVADTEKVLRSVRRLSFREVANLMCFPATFTQPAGSSNKQMYRTLGNSVNVRVVAALLHYLASF